MLSAGADIVGVELAFTKMAEKGGRLTNQPDSVTSVIWCGRPNCLLISTIPDY